MEYTNMSPIERHPCFTKAAHNKYVRLHLPVAPVCNIQCKYCVRGLDCVNEARPGVASRVLLPHEALDTVSRLAMRDGRISVIAIAGPGDPLANEGTFQTLRLIHREFPELFLCISTNGLLLPKRIHMLTEAGVGSITITINSVDVQTASRIYSWAMVEGRMIRGVEASESLIENQWMGLELAVAAGLYVKINTVAIPGINDRQIVQIAKKASQLGAYIMNIMPLIPQGQFKDIPRPCSETIKGLRQECALHIEQMWHCKQCRADAFGTLTEDKDMDLEMLYSYIGSDYCDMVV